MPGDSATYLSLRLTTSASSSGRSISSSRRRGGDKVSAAGSKRAKSGSSSSAVVNRTSSMMRGLAGLTRTMRLAGSGETGAEAAGAGAAWTVLGASQGSRPLYLARA